MLGDGIMNIEQTLFVIGWGLIGFCFPEWLCLYSNKKFKGVLQNFLTAIAFSDIAYYFVCTH
jgi:hypothetical protein